MFAVRDTRSVQRRHLVLVPPRRKPRGFPAGHFRQGLLHLLIREAFGPTNRAGKRFSKDAKKPAMAGFVRTQLECSLLKVTWLQRRWATIDLRPTNNFIISLCVFSVKRA